MRRQFFHFNPVFAALLLAAPPVNSQIPEIVPLAPAELWHRAEFRADHLPAAINRFDPDQIRVDAIFISPSGKSLMVPAFWYQDFSRALKDGEEVLTPNGEPEWRIRFMPAEPGEYALSLSVHTNGAPAANSAAIRFNVPSASTSVRHGTVRIAPDRRYFETSDGRPLHLIGHNVCWAEHHGTFDYDTWFGEMKDAGENFARLWMAPWFVGLEHKPGTLNHYDLQGAWQLDTIFQQAEQDGIYLMLCFDHHGMFQVDNPNWGGNNNFWKTNPYNATNGGPCAGPNDFFTDSKARAVYQKRLRYLVGRYSYSPQLLAWQFFNEIDNVFGPLNAQDVIAWHREMGQWFHTHDPYQHLVTTSLTGGSERPEVWSIPELDFAIYHSYGESAPGRGAASIAQAFVKRYGKPAMIGEFGIDWRTWNIAADPYLRGFRQGLWCGALGGSVGTSMSWWWQDLHTDNVYGLYSSMNQILGAAHWQEGAWTPVDFDGPAETPPSDLTEPIRNGNSFDAALSLNPVRRLKRKMPGALAVASPLAAERASESLSGYLRGAKEADLQRSIKLTAFAGAKSRVLFHVKSVASDAELVVRIDGVEMLRRTFPGLEATAVKPQEVNQDFSFDLAPGKRTIEIANDHSADWILVDSLKLDQVRPAAFAGGWDYPVEPVGLRSGGKAIVYLCSPDVVYPAGALRYNPRSIANQTVTLAHWPAGKFTVRWFDPSTGRTEGTVGSATSGGTLLLSPPAFREDLVAIVAPAGGR